MVCVDAVVIVVCSQLQAFDCYVFRRSLLLYAVVIVVVAYNRTKVYSQLLRTSRLGMRQNKEKTTV